MLLKLPSLPVPALPAGLPVLPSPKQALKRLPLHVLRTASKAPLNIQRAVLTKVLERAFQEPLEDGDFEFLQGHWMKVEITDLGLSWYFSHSEQEGLIVSADEVADAAIRGNLKEFMLLATRAEDPDTLFFQRRLMIEGDTEIGLEVKNLMDAVDHDSLPPLVKLVLTRGSGLLNRLF